MNFTESIIFAVLAHRAIYVFKTKQKYDKACKLLNTAIDLSKNKSGYEHSKVDSEMQISIPEENHGVVESMWKKHKIVSADYERTSSEISTKK